MQDRVKIANSGITHQDLTQEQVEQRLDASFAKLQQLEQRILNPDPHLVFASAASSDGVTAFSSGHRSPPAGRLIVHSHKPEAPAPTAVPQAPTLGS